MKSLLTTVLILLLIFCLVACTGVENGTKPSPKSEDNIVLETKSAPKSEDNIVLTRLENVILDSKMDKEIGVVLIAEDGKTYDVIFKEHFDYNMTLAGGSTTINMSKLTVSIGDDFIIGFKKDDVDIITFEKGRSYEIVFDGDTIIEIRESK